MKEEFETTENNIRADQGKSEAQDRNEQAFMTMAISSLACEPS
jgi:hypothetical protein